MSKKTFDEFYYLNTNKNHNFDEINNYAERNNGNYMPYKGKMRCPECCLAELTFIPAYPPRGAHLKKIPSSNHHQDCSYNYKYANNAMSKNYIESLNEQQMENKIISMMRFLTQLDNRNEVNIQPRLSAIEQNPFLIKTKNNRSEEKKILRRKKLIGYIDKEDVGNNLYLIYGNAKLSIEEKEGIDKNTKQKYKYYILSMKTLNRNNEWKFRCSIYRGRIRDNIDEQVIYKIVMIGYFDFNYKYLQIRLLKKNAIKYEENR